MSYTVNHAYVDTILVPELIQVDPTHFIVRCAESGTFSVDFPGKLHVAARAGFQIRVESGTHDDGPGPGGPLVQFQNLVLTIEVVAPDGQLFTPMR